MLIRIALFITVIKEVYSYVYPQEYDLLVTNIRNTTTKISVALEPRFITLSYNIIYMYSLYQIYFNKCLTIVTPYFTILSSSILVILKQYNLLEQDSVDPSDVSNMANQYAVIASQRSPFLSGGTEGTIDPIDGYVKFMTWLEDLQPTIGKMFGIRP